MAKILRKVLEGVSVRILVGKTRIHRRLRKKYSQNKIFSFEFPNFVKFRCGKYRTAFPVPELAENRENYKKMI